MKKFLIYFYTLTASIYLILGLILRNDTFYSIGLYMLGIEFLCGLFYVLFIMDRNFKDY